MENNNPLVSVTVITYNSSRFVLETLESIKAQTYQNIELIVSDDCSTDDTNIIVGEWLNNNRERFVNTHHVMPPVNTGIPANKNRAIRLCKGDWIKSIAGDDLLMPTCVEQNIQETLVKPNYYIFLSDMLQFHNSTEHKSRVMKPNFFHLPVNNKTLAEVQHKFLLRSSFGNSPTLFIGRIVLLTLMPFNEKYRLIEDHPFALKATNKGYSFSYFNKITVKYRVSNQSVFMSSGKTQLYNKFYIMKKSFDDDMILPNISLIERVMFRIEFYRLKFIDEIGLNRRNFAGKFIYYTTKIFTPFYIYKLLLKNYYHLISKWL